MARRKIAYKGAQAYFRRASDSIKTPSGIRAQSVGTVQDVMQFVVDRPHFYLEVEAFRDYFLLQVANVTVSLTAGGVTSARAALLGAETPWGQARMRGEYFGVSFKPYGKGPGRYDTGNMYDALKVLETDGSFGQARVSFGYDMSMDRSPSTGGERNTVGRPYFQAQERGFVSTRKFSPSRTAATGVASFDERRTVKRVRGAFALPKAAEAVRKRIDAAFSAAWNEAKRAFEADGFSSENVGRYVDARDAYRRNPPRKPSFGNDAGPSGTFVPASRFKFQDAYRPSKEFYDNLYRILGGRI